MNMTPEERIESNYAALQAHKAGRPVQFWSVNEFWDDITGEPTWFNNMTYRPKPKPVQHPWSKPEDVPGPVCWIRRDGGIKGLFLTTGIFKDGLAVNLKGDGFFYSWQGLATQWEYSTDLKTWHPCTVEEGQ